MRAINVLLAILVSVFMGVAVLEIGLRLIGRGPERTFLEFDEKLGWRKQPGVRQGRSTREFDVHFDINELGLRDDPMSEPAKPANTFRVLMLGDSFTLGFSVEREDLFVDILEDWWQAENRRVDVINAGTQGYSTDQSVLWFREHGADYQPDLVVLCAYENDLYWNGVKDYNGKPKPMFTPTGELATGALADTTVKSWQDRWAITSLFRPRAGVTPDHVFTPEGSTRPILKEQGALLLKEPDFMRAAVQSTRGALSAWKADCDAIGARPLMLAIPSHSAVDADYQAEFSSKRLGLPADRWSPDKPVDTFLALARDIGIETLDPRTYLKGAGGGELYYELDWHVNPLGNRELARYLHDELDHLGAFGASHGPPAGVPVAMPVVDHRAGLPFALKLYLALWAALSLLYIATYKDEPRWQPPLKVAALLGAVFGIVIGGNWLVAMLPPKFAGVVLALFVVGVLTFVAYKLGNRLATIAELIRAFVMRGHWYLMPLVVVLLTIGSLLVVAASSPLVAPFIYTLF